MKRATIPPDELRAELKAERDSRLRYSEADVKALRDLARQLEIRLEIASRSAHFKYGHALRWENCNVDFCKNDKKAIADARAAHLLD